MKLLALSLRLALAAALVTLTGCAWIQAHQTQLAAVGGVALDHLARDVKTAAANALLDQANSGFDNDWKSSLIAGAYSLTPVVLSSGNLQDYLDAWNPAAPDVNAKIAQSVSALDGTKVATALKDPSQAKAFASAVGVTIGDALLASGTTSAK